MHDDQIGNFTEEEKLITSLVAKGRVEQVGNEKFAIIGLDSFYGLFTHEEVGIMKRPCNSL
jgi:hypothetical protein